MSALIRVDYHRNMPTISIVSFILMVPSLDGGRGSHLASSWGEKF